MKTTTLFVRIALAASLLSLLATCRQPCPEPTVADLVAKTVTSDSEQAKLTTDAVITQFKEGNLRFCNGQLTVRNHTKQVRQAAQGQYPKAVVLSCADSRIPIEDVFDMGIGDLLVARVAGNIVNDDILGTMEFGCGVAGAKVILVMGHESCGAVKAAIDNVDSGKITALVTKIKRAIHPESEFNGERSSRNKAYVHHVCEANIQQAISDIRANSPALVELESSGKIAIVGAVYDIDTGAVTFL